MARSSRSRKARKAAAVVPIKQGPRKVMLATPCGDGRLEAWCASAIADTVRMASKYNCEVHQLFRCYESILPHVRNDYIANMLKGGYDDIVFIDSDEPFQPEAVFKLLAHPVDVVGAAVRKKTNLELYNVKNSSVNIPVDIKTGLLLPEGLGTGFLRLSRHACQVLWDNSEAYEFVAGAGECRWIFDVRPQNGLLISEDIRLCYRLKELGIPVHLDPTFTISHVGPLVYPAGDFNAFLQRKQAEEAARSTPPPPPAPPVRDTSNALG